MGTFFSLSASPEPKPVAACGMFIHESSRASRGSPVGWRAESGGINRR
jgi:hypothetical protein